MKLRIAHLNSAGLEGSGLRRDLPPDFLPAEQDIETHYDWTTLWFDAVWTGRKLALIGPLPFGFEDAFQNGGLFLDGLSVMPLRTDIHTSTATTWLSAKHKPEHIGLKVGGKVFESGISDRSDERFFAGKNTVVLKQKDNDLMWIRDFLRFHREVHGLEAALLFDDSSKRYDLNDLAQAMADSGLERAMIIPTPFRFGARGRSNTGRYNWAGASLQYGLLHIARRRFLRQARAVLQCDIDELVWCRSGRSIFDMVRWHPLGFVHFSTSWRYSAEDQPVRHNTHIWKRRSADPAAPKYCVRPSGPLFWANWEVHKLEGLGMRSWQLSKRASAWHMKMLTTNWKPFQDRQALPKDLEEDPEIIAAFNKIDFDTLPEDVSVELV